MNNHARMTATLNRQPVDRIAVQETFWHETVARWNAEGQLAPGIDLNAAFGLAIRKGGWLNSSSRPDVPDEILEETEDTQLRRNADGAVLRWHKKHASTPEHVAFEVTDRAGWDARIRPHLLDVDRTRIPFEGYRGDKKRAAANHEYFMWNGVGPFEQIHPMCGHEHMLVGMVDDPDWVADMCDVYTDLTLRHLDLLFAEEGAPDGLWFYEDMGFKERPFMGPAMYEELVQPSHAKLFAWAHARGLKVVVHSCGFVEPLVPGLIDAGLDMLQAIEVKAGMHLPRLAERFGDRIGFMGGYDVRELASNDRARVDAEFDRAVRPLLDAGVPYVLHSDHSIPPDVDVDTLRYFQATAVEHSRRR